MVITIFRGIIDGYHERAETFRMLLQDSGTLNGQAPEVLPASAGGAADHHRQAAAGGIPCHRLDRFVHAGDCDHRRLEPAAVRAPNVQRRRGRCGRGVHGIWRETPVASIVRGTIAPPIMVT
jgi:hypothetical protein